MKTYWNSEFYQLPGWMNTQDREMFRNFTMRGDDMKDYEREHGLINLRDSETLTLTSATHFTLVSIGVSK